jgi:tRNA1(Val) A37 N6-methylase TrmN6
LQTKSRLIPGGQTPKTSDDAILDGRLRLRQPLRGHRIGHDAILLAAATGARAGDRIVELGAGVGASGLALLARVPGASVTLVEVDPVLAALAAENIVRNQFAARARAVALDVGASVEAFASVGLSPGSVDRVLMNPPFNDPARQTISPDPRRRTAHAAEPDTLSLWVGVAERLLNPAGTLTMIWRADDLDDVLAALSPRFGSVTILPVHGRAGQPAIRVLLRAAKPGRVPSVMLPALMLNDAGGKPTRESERVLRDAEPLPLAEI